ncbi:MAG TPA: 50S ribosomal protein L32 [Bdellovibrionota bacterium]|nr:50S ribosomal protein L32 [Bdellovibrionota bacterium]
MPVPKRKVSKSRVASRRAQDKMTPPGHIRPCPQCAEPMLMHRICSSCGYYRGKEVVEIPIE